MLRPLVSLLLALAISALPSHAVAQAPPPAVADPLAILARAKAASGGPAWDRLTSQHTKVRILSGGRTANVERWVDIPAGRSYLTFEIGDVKGAQGFDGRRAWSRQGAEPPRVEISTVARELAVNAAYRDRLAFWFPDRGRARIEYKERASIGVTGYDVVRILPEGGRPFDFWVNRDTGLIDRLVEPEAVETRTETYSEFRDVQGVKIPFLVKATRTDDPRTDEIVSVLLIEYNVDVSGVEFSPQGLPALGFRFPEGRKSVSVPIEIHNGHVYVRAKIDGKGPFLLLFAPSGTNVVVPEVARSLGPAEGSPQSTIEATLDIGGFAMTASRFAVAAPQSSAERSEGVPMQGMTGLEIVRSVPVRIDYAGSRLTFYDPDVFRYEGKAPALPLEAIGGLPVVRARIAGVDGVFALDLGTRTSVVLAQPFWSANKLDEKLRAGPERIIESGSAGIAHARPARAPALELAGTTVAQPVTLLSTATTGLYAQEGLAGTLGYGVLRRFGIVLDAPHERLFLEPNGALAEPDTFDRSGLWLEPSAKGLAVTEVVDGGPAAQAGIKTGDVIVSLNGEPASVAKLSDARSQLSGPPGTKVRARLASGRETTLTLRDLF